MTAQAKSTQLSSRKRKLNRRQKKKVVKSTATLPNSFKILRHALAHLWQKKYLYIRILAIYFILYTVFVKGLAANFQLGETKDLLSETFSGELSSIGTASTLLGFLLGSASSTSGEAASVYQLILFVIFSLIIIWSLRTTFDSSEHVHVKQAFYQSSYPLVQFVLVGLMIILQCLPGMLGFMIYSIVISNGIAVAAWEQIMWFLIMLAGVITTVYFISSSLFASYIVTLPKMTPLSALRSARKLVKYRRFSVIRKVLFLPFILLVLFVIIFLPLVFYVPLVAELLFMIAGLVAVFIMHAYFYTMYREML